MASKLQSMVEGALTPTAADPNMGNAWDEARKRFEAFASGTDTGAYGAEFKQLFDSLGMSAQQAADAFRNFSLFADPKNLKLVDFGPIAESVKTQLDGMIGKANLTSAAMEEVWKNLSPQQKAALGTQGIDNVTDAVTALINPAGLAEQNVQGIGTAVKAIPEKRTTTFDIKKTDTFDATYKDIADKISAIPTDVTVRVRLADGLPDTGGSSGGSSGGLGNPLRERAGGGPVFAGTPYMVGENGPEMFVPRVSGSIVPNSRVQNFGGITINGNFFVRSDADVSAIANALAKRWGRAAALRSAMRI